MLENIKVFCHSSIMFDKAKKIYIDPFRIKENFNNADIIFITHDHYDHFSKDDIEKVRKENSIIVIPESLIEEVKNLGFNSNNIITVKPNEKYEIKKIKFETIPAYNINKNFHPKQNNWVGYIIELDNIKYYIAGDTDITPENSNVKCDVAFLPIGGTYTTDYKEAANLANQINPKIVVPIHYGEIVGTKQDALDFAELLNSHIQCEFLIN